ALASRREPRNKANSGWSRSAWFRASSEQCRIEPIQILRAKTASRLNALVGLLRSYGEKGPLPGGDRMGESRGVLGWKKFCY
ncbi:MAG: hypothetical protein ACYSTZ_11070, partial [Planctomycetota bacterium]